MENDLIELANLVGWLELRPHYSGAGSRDSWAVTTRNLNDFTTVQTIDIADTPAQAVAEALRSAQERYKATAPVNTPKRLLKRPGAL